MKLKEYAKKHGLHYNTVYNWFHQGKLKNAYQLDTGTIIINEQEDYIPQSKNKQQNVVIYCRVSSRQRKECINTQIQRCINFANSKGYIVNNIYSEIASGMNDNRKQLLKMLNSNPTKIIVQNKDRLTRFGFNYLKVLLEKQGCQIVVLNNNYDDKEDLIRDMISIITSFCGRLYGLRRTKNKVNKIKEVIKNDNL